MALKCREKEGFKWNLMHVQWCFRPFRNLKKKDCKA